MLHPLLISSECQTLIDVAEKMDVLGCNVNGAGGPDGGSVTILCSSQHAREMLITEIYRNQRLTSRVFEHRIATGGLRPSVVIIE